MPGARRGAIKAKEAGKAARTQQGMGRGHAALRPTVEGTSVERAAVCMITGLRRSALYVPCDSEKMVEKAICFPADLLLLNLEDGVAAARKDTAREIAVRALRSIDFGVREIVVRINDFESDIGARDLAAVLPCRPDGICVPKVESPAAMQEVARRMSRGAG